MYLWTFAYEFRIHDHLSLLTESKWSAVPIGMIGTINHLQGTPQIGIGSWVLQCSLREENKNSPNPGTLSKYRILKTFDSYFGFITVSLQLIQKVAVTNFLADRRLFISLLPTSARREKIWTNDNIEMSS